MPPIDDTCADEVNQKAGDATINTSQLKEAVTKTKIAKQPTPQLWQSVTKRRQSDDTRMSNSSPIFRTDSREFTYIDDQLVQVTKGVLPKYEIQLNQKKYIEEQVRERYRTVKVKD